MFRHIIALALFGCLGLLAGIVFHELTHAAILTHYGCSYSFGFEGYRPYTYAGEQCIHRLSSAQYQRLVLVQDVVEAAGYQLIPLYGLGSMVFGLQLIGTGGDGDA
jgi:hypothetical protein